MGSFYGSFGITPDDDAPELIVQPNGRVSLILGDLSLHFPSLPAYDAWQETVDRSRAALGQRREAQRNLPAILAYYKRVRDQSCERVDRQACATASGDQEPF